MDTVFSSYIVHFEKDLRSRGNDIHITKPYETTNYNFLKWQTESNIPRKIVNEILICVLSK